MNRAPPCRICSGMGVLILDGDYPIRHGGQTVGNAKVTTEGMFLRIKCRCVVPKDRKYSVVMCRDDGKTDLGICVPYGAEIGLMTRIPKKSAGQGSIQFLLLPRAREYFYPLTVPFPQIALLRKGKFCIRCEKAGILVTEAPAKPGSGQNP